MYGTTVKQSLPGSHSGIGGHAICKGMVKNRKSRVKKVSSKSWALHRRAQYPRREFGAAEVEAFALGRLPRSGLEHEIENALTALLHGLLAIQDGAAIDVHIVFHPLVHRRVGRKLDRGRGLAAEHAAAPGGEADEIGAARDLACGRHRVVARRIHEHETLLGDGLGVVD